MRKTLRLFTILLTAVLLFTFSACGSTESNEPEDSDTTKSSEDPKASEGKDSITIAYNAEPVSLASYEANNLTTHSVCSNLYDTLIREESDGELVPGLASEWTYSDDNTEIVFTLREGIKFHDGSEMTAEDVVFSMNTAIASSKTARMTGSFEKMEKVDDTHVKLYLKYPYGAVESCLSNDNCGIFSKAAYEKDPEGFTRNPVATGPYKIVSWTAGESVVMEAFADYWREPAAIKNLTFRIVPDASSGLVALETGQIDVLNLPNTTDFDYIESNSKLQLSTTAANSFYFVAFNCTDGLFAENKVLREVVANAIDPEAILLGALDGHGELVNCAIPVNVKFFPQEFDGYSYNPDYAKQLLKESGFEGQKIKIPCMDVGNDLAITEVVVEQLKAVGFDAEIDMMESTAFLADVYTNCLYDICVNSYTCFINDADGIMYMRYHSDYLGGGNNFVMYNNPEMDSLLDKARSSDNDDERALAYRDACTLMRDDYVLVPILCYLNALAADADLNGIKASDRQRIYVYDFSW